MNDLIYRLLFFAFEYSDVNISFLLKYDQYEPGSYFRLTRKVSTRIFFPLFKFINVLRSLIFKLA